MSIYVCTTKVHSDLNDEYLLSHVYVSEDANSWFWWRRGILPSDLVNCTLCTVVNEIHSVRYILQLEWGKTRHIAYNFYWWRDAAATTTTTRTHMHNNTNKKSWWDDHHHLTIIKSNTSSLYTTRNVCTKMIMRTRKIHFACVCVCVCSSKKKFIHFFNKWVTEDEPAAGKSFRLFTRLSLLVVG